VAMRLRVEGKAPGLSLLMQGRSDARRQWWGRALTHERHVQDVCLHCGMTSDTWRALLWPSWGAVLGYLRAELGHGP
jgi:transposase